MWETMQSANSSCAAAQTGAPLGTLRDEKGQFLDDITLEELGRALGCRAVSIPTDGGGCCKAMLSTHKRKTIKFKR